MRVMVQAQAQTKAQLQHVTMLLQDLVLRMQEVEPLLEAQTKAQLQHVKRTALLEAQTQAQCHAGASMLSAHNDVVAGPNAARDEASHNSFTPNDGIRLQTEGYGSTEKEASEHACRQAVAHLLMTEPSQLLLRRAHWTISLSALLEGLPGTEAVHRALPVHAPARSLDAGVEAANLTAAEVDDRVADLLRRCLNAHGGSFNPSRISSAALGQEPGEERIYSQLNKLLLPRGLRRL